MNRAEYLKLCLKCSELENGIQNIKQDVPEANRVIYNGVVYYPESFKIIFEKGKPINRAILHSLLSNSIIECDLERVEKYEKQKI